MNKLLLLTVVFLFGSGLAHAEELSIQIYAIDTAGQGKSMGTLTAASSAYGTILTPDLAGLSPGLHGFHVHEKPSCTAAEKDGKMVPGLSAGGHYDPAHTNAHRGPYGDGHLGDLPALYVDAAGKATHPVLAPRIKISDLKSRAVIIHAGGDNYADEPEKLGGGGARAACGIVK